MSYNLDSLPFWGLSPLDLGIGDDPTFFPLMQLGGGMTWLDRQRRGEYIPAFLNETQLGLARKRIRSLCLNNDLAVNIVNAHVAYICGGGFKYEVSAKDDNDGALASDVQVLIDAFIEHNELPLREAETVSRVMVDGECFWRIFPTESGIISTRFIEPECIKSPTGGMQDGSSFGIQTSINDVETVKGYWVVQTPSGEGDRPTWVDACDVLHFKHFETPSCSKRGLTPFFAVEGPLRGAEDLLHSTITLAKSRAKIAWIRKIPGASQAIAESMVAAQTDVTVTEPVTGNVTNIERLPHGSVLTIPDGMEIEFPSAQIAASDHMQVYAAAQRTIAARFSMPEYMLTSDASNGNYASTLVAESPFVKAMSRQQDVFARLLGGNRWPGHRQSLIWRQIDHAVRVGLLPPDVRRRIDVQVTGPTLTVRDVDKEARIDQIYNGMGIKSKTTIQHEQGLDPDEERQNFATEVKEGNASNPQQTPAVPGMTPQEQQQGDQQAEQAGKQIAGKGKPMPLQESFNEQDHPRAANGQFGSGGGSTGGDSKPDHRQAHAQAKERHAQDLKAHGERQKARDTQRQHIASRRESVAKLNDFPLSVAKDADPAGQMQEATHAVLSAASKAGVSSPRFEAKVKVISGKAVEKIHAARAKADKAKATLEEVGKARVALGNRPEEPEEPSYDAAYAKSNAMDVESPEYDKQFAEDDKAYEKASAAHEKAHAKWERDSDRWDAATEKLDAKQESAEEVVESSREAEEEAYEDAASRIDDLATALAESGSESLDDEEADLDDAESKDEEPEEPEEPEDDDEY